MFYTIRTCLPLSAGSTDDSLKQYFGSGGVFRKVQMNRKRVTDEAMPPKTRDLITVEDLSEDAVPVSCHEVTHMSPAEKVQQLGVDACSKMLSAQLLGMEKSGRFHVMVVDLSVHTNDLARGVIEMRKGFPNISFIGFCASETEVEWAANNTENALVEALLRGDWKATDFQVPPEACPEELLAKSPDKPVLKVCVLQEPSYDGSDTPNITCKIPDPVLKAWHDHGEFGAEFQKLVQVGIESGVLEHGTRAATAGAGRKRPNPSASSPQAVKKAKDEHALTEDWRVNEMSMCVGQSS